jgi:serine/threonine protein kinase
MLLAGSTLSRYRILSHLGAGWMGEVYLVEDTRLGRKIALKLLPPRLTAQRAPATLRAGDPRGASESHDKMKRV